MKPTPEIRRKFPKGRLVQFFDKARYGTVVGYGMSNGKEWTGIRVQELGKRSPETYSPTFWKPWKI